MQNQKNVNERRFNVGNLVHSPNDELVHIISVVYSDGTIVLDNGETYSSAKLHEIPLTDDFLTLNNYNETVIDGETRYFKSVFVRKDGYGPAVTKTLKNEFNFEHEYSVAGIIVRSVSDLQNLMNVCRCSDISDSYVID